jgi:hypothetical protein
LNNTHTQNTKKHKITIVESDIDIAPSGSQWDSTNWSCAYDSLFVILYNIWSDNPEKWSTTFENINAEYLGLLADEFEQVHHNRTTLEAARDTVREILHDNHPDAFPSGATGTSVGELAFRILDSEQCIAKSRFVCAQCNTKTTLKRDRQFAYKLEEPSGTPNSTANWISDIETKTNKKCASCNCVMSKETVYKHPPELLVMEYPEVDITTSHSITLQVGDNEQKVLHLRGIVYYSNYHFASRVIGQSGTIWFHDGMTTGKNCINEGNLNSMSDAVLRVYDNKVLTLVIYAE